MSRLVISMMLLTLVVCSGKREPAAQEKTYPMTATIVSRDPAQNIVSLNNKEVPGVMEAMRMDYPLRGANVAALPPDGTAVEVQLHESDGRYWVTDVKPVSATASPGRQ